MRQPIADRILCLGEPINSVQLQITSGVKSIKDHCDKAAATKRENSSYLNSVQTDSMENSQLLTGRCIEVSGVGAVKILEFINIVIRFANCWKRKIRVVRNPLPSYGRCRHDGTQGA